MKIFALISTLLLFVLFFFFVRIFPSKLPCIAVVGANCNITAFEYFTNSQNVSK
ncbi:hypothetical protein IT403_03315 [Candidatus Nomurabacteria bacterium]|nr:hypothetical protein [Candidatus Nomurabacteria bacterium]